MNLKAIYTVLFLFVTVVLSAQNTNQFDNNGKRHGVWKKNYDHTKQLRYEGQFEHGKEIGLFKFYKLLGGKSVLSATKAFNADNTIADVKFYASTGKLISEGQMEGKHFIGKWIYYHNNTNGVMTTETYNNKGQLHGEKLVYYDNGQVAEKTNYLNGKIEGLSVWYSEKAIAVKEFNYENDELHGLSKYYDVNGQLLAEGHYKRGKKNGIWKYYKNGKLVEEKDFTVRSKSRRKQ